MAKRIRLKFNKGFYSLAAVKQSMHDYSKVADSQTERNKNYFIVSLSNFNEDVVDRLADEFSNYVLSVEATRDYGKIAGNK